MKRIPNMTSLRKPLLAVLLILLLAGCSVLPDVKPRVVDHFVLDAVAVAEVPVAEMPRELLRVSMPQANAALDTPRMAYQPRAHVLRYFANSRWADTPTRMLQQLLVSALGDSGRYRAVMTDGNTGAALRLDSYIETFHQDFTRTPSEFRVVLRVQWVDTRRREVLASRVIDVSEAAATEDPYAGAVAANKALARVLSELIKMDVSAAESP